MDTSFKIRPNAIEILEENYNASDKSLDFPDWALNESTKDPSFYSWLFPDAENINDFGSGMSFNQVQTADKFMQQIEVLDYTRHNDGNQ